MLRPQERLGALLGGRDVALACEELALRARQDVDAGRWREAALQLDAALTVALPELEPWSPRGDLGARLAELRGLHDVVRAAARAALQGGVEDADAAAVQHALERLEAASCGPARPSVSTDRPPAGARSRRSGECSPPITGVGSRAPDIEV